MPDKRIQLAELQARLAGLGLLDNEDDAADLLAVNFREVEAVFRGDKPAPTSFDERLQEAEDLQGVLARSAAEAAIAEYGITGQLVVEIPKQDEAPDLPDQILFTAAALARRILQEHPEFRGIPVRIR
jgi:hypothetical protein